jgi:hypothetical protein
VVRRSGRSPTKPRRAGKTTHRGRATGEGARATREEQERLAKEQAQQRAERLEELLRAQGIDPDRLLDV